MQVEATAVGDLLSKANFEIILADVISSRKEDDALAKAIRRAASACAEIEQRSIALEMSDQEKTKLTSLMGRLQHKVRYLEAVQYLDAC
jgi:predicted nucleotidyltransferase